MDILKRGGNAADATVTTALCEGVFNPMASGIGGGGFITVLTKDGTAEVIDAREYAPTGATEKMYKGNTLRTLLCSFRIHPHAMLDTLSTNCMPEHGFEDQHFVIGTELPCHRAALPQSCLGHCCSC